MASSIAESVFQVNAISGLFRGIGLLIVTWLASTILYGLYNVFLHPLRSYPGPLLWRAYRFPYARSLLTGRYPFDVHELHKKYGHVVRVAPGELSYTTSEALKPIYGHHNSATEGFSEFDKDRMEYQRPLSGSWSILGAPMVDHSRHRKMFAYSFSDRGLRDMQPRIQEYVELLIKGMKEDADTSEHLDIVARYNWATFDMIGDLAFGESFRCLENKTTDPWIVAVFGNVKIGAFMSMIRHYNLAGLLPYLTPKHLTELRLKNMKNTVDKVEKRIQQGTERGDFWDKVIEKSDFEKGTGMTKSEMVSNAGVLVLGGSETTATLLSGTTYLLLKHPDIFNKLNDEVRSAFRHEDEIDLVSVSKLDYMLAVLDEGMRVYPPVPNAGNRVVPPGGAMVAGEWVAGGTSLQVLQYAANHSPANFYRPDDFVPERWLANPPVEFANDDRAARAPFSAGPRNCIGRSLAYAEMRLILAKVCFNFDLELDEERCGDWIKQQKVFTIWEKTPLWVKLKSVRRE